MGSGMNHLKLIIQDLTLNTTFSLQTAWLCPGTQLTKAFCKLSRTTYGHTSTWRTRSRPSAARRSTGQRTGSLSTSRTRIINTRRGLLDQILETISLDPIHRLVLVLH